MRDKYKHGNRQSARLAVPTVKQRKQRKLAEEMVQRQAGGRTENSSGGKHT